MKALRTVESSTEDDDKDDDDDDDDDDTIFIPFSSPCVNFLRRAVFSFLFCRDCFFSDSEEQLGKRRN